MSPDWIAPAKRRAFKLGSRLVCRRDGFPGEETVQGMKKKPTKNRTRTTKNHDALSSKDPWGDWNLDDLANQIERMCRRKLPNGVMGGILCGKEPEIRQDTTIRLLKGFLFKNVGFAEAAERKDQDAATYHLERAVSIILRHQKARLKRKLAKEQSRQVEISERNAGLCVHPVELDYWELPLAIRVEMHRASLRLGVGTGLITLVNAGIMSKIIDSEASVENIAKSLGITRGAIYQRVNRVRRVTARLLARIEAPMP